MISSQTNLNQRILNKINQDYQSPVKKISYLNQGDNGAVYYLQLEDGNEFCVKSILKTNNTANKDYTLYQAVYKKQFNFNFYEDESYYYFTMPFFKGQNLEKLMASSLLGLDLRLMIFKKITEAVNNIHACGIIHRDLKAANIIVSINNLIENRIEIEVNIIDFGRAVRVFDEKGKTNEALALDNSTNIFYQIARKYQSQTAPDYSSVWDTLQKWTGMKFFSRSSEDSIGFRSDYYALGHLFQMMVPEYAHLAQDVITHNGIERNSAFHDLCDNVNGILEVLHAGLQQDQELSKAGYRQI